MFFTLIASAALVSACVCEAPLATAQTAGSGTAELREVKCDGQKKLTEGQIAGLTGLQTGTQVGREDLQKAADKLVASGLFATVKYDFKTRAEGLTLDFHVTESPRVPAYYDNFPWFGDSELNDAIRAQLPFFDGTLPEAGNVVDIAADAIHGLLVAHKLDLPVVQQHLSEINGKPYSRTTIDVFLAEQIRPVYLRQGYLKAKLGPPEARLSGPPTAKLPEELPVYVPVATGDVYHFGDVQWSGNNVISSIALGAYLGLKNGAVANGMEMEAALEQIREEYGRRGYLDATVQPESSFDDAAHTVSYKIAISEGKQYHMGGWVITGISSNGESRVRTTFPIAAGDVFDKIKYEDYLVQLQSHSKDIFGELPVHYDSVGHWLRADAAKGTVDVLLDFK